MVQQSVGLFLRLCQWQEGWSYGAVTHSFVCGCLAAVGALTAHVLLNRVHRSCCRIHACSEKKTIWPILCAGLQFWYGACLSLPFESKHMTVVVFKMVWQGIMLCVYESPCMVVC